MTTVRVRLICIDAACLPPDLGDVPGLDPDGGDDGSGIEPSDDGMPDDPTCPLEEDFDDDVTTDPTFPVFIGGTWLTEYHLDWSEYLGPLADFMSLWTAIDRVSDRRDPQPDPTLGGSPSKKVCR